MNTATKVTLTCLVLIAITGICTAEFATKKKKIPSETTLKQDCGQRFANILGLMPQLDAAMSRLLVLKADLQLLTVDHLTGLLEGADAQKFFGRASKTELNCCAQKLAELEEQLQKEILATTQLEAAVRSYRDYLHKLDKPEPKALVKV